MLDKTLRNSLAVSYHENTSGKISSFGDYDLLPQYKIYPGARAFPIDEAPDEGGSEFVQLLLNRRSRREFSLAGISRKQLGRLLSLGVGLNHRTEKTMRFRTYASAGARYPIEVYSVVLRSEDMPLGIYHYNILDNSLELIREGNFEKDLQVFYANQDGIIFDAPCYLLFSMVFERTMQKYGERGYRFMYLDAGHMSQNLYLAAEHLGLGAVGIGGADTDDSFMDHLLRVNGAEESFFYGMAVGIPEE